MTHTEQTKQLIDALKAVCASNGLGNDGNEFKIITQAFLYKYLNDKFMFDVCAADKTLKVGGKVSIESQLAAKSPDEYDMLLMKLGPVAKLKPRHLLSNLAARQNEGDFHKLFDETLLDIGRTNERLFSISTDGGAKIVLFDALSQFITDPGKRDAFCRAIINKLTAFSFAPMFGEKYDFFATIFEYLIKDYNKDGGGKYAEYYTPHSVAKIMSAILVDGSPSNVKCYDPSAGSGTLLMSIAHAIGEEKCTIYSQDISQKSTGMLRLNLVLNNLVHSIPNVVQGDTILHPHHRDKNGDAMKFDYIVSNPPFKLDFSDDRETLAGSPGSNARFFAGIPKIPNKEKDKMAIYLLFIQHIMFSLNATGKAAVVVPTGFVTAQSGIEMKIRQKLVDNKWLKGVVSMPSNIFATTGTNVSVLFIDKQNKGDVVLVDASKLGEKVKEGKNQKTLLSHEDEQKIISAFASREAVEDFSVILSYDAIKAKNYSFAAGQYFEIKIEYSEITPKEFQKKIADSQTNLRAFFEESEKLENEILRNLAGLKLEEK